MSTIYELVFSGIYPYIIIGLSAGITGLILYLIKNRSFTKEKFITGNFIDEQKQLHRSKIFEKNLHTVGKFIFAKFKYGDKEGLYQVNPEGYSPVFYNTGKPNIFWKVGNTKPMDPLTFKIPKDFGAVEIKSMSDAKVALELNQSIYSKKEIILFFLVIIGIAVTGVLAYMTWNNAQSIDNLIKVLIDRFPVITQRPNLPNQVEIPAKP